MEREYPDSLTPIAWECMYVQGSNSETDYGRKFNVRKKLINVVLDMLASRCEMKNTEV